MWHRRTAAEKSKDVAHLATYYWHRLMATCGCWFFWDFGFYGNKVFQSQFVKIITGGGALSDAPPVTLPAHTPAESWCMKPLRRLLAASVRMGSS